MLLSPALATESSTGDVRSQLETPAASGDECGSGVDGVFGYGKGEECRGERADMGKIGFTWDREGERVGGVMPFSRIGEDLADGAVGTVAWGRGSAGAIATPKTGAAPCMPGWAGAAAEEALGRRVVLEATCSREGVTEDVEGVRGRFCGGELRGADSAGELEGGSDRGRECGGSRGAERWPGRGWPFLGRVSGAEREGAAHLERCP